MNKNTPDSLSSVKFAKYTFIIFVTLMTNNLNLLLPLLVKQKENVYRFVCVCLDDIWMDMSKKTLMILNNREVE